VPSAKKTAANQRKFFFRNSRAFVLYRNDRVLLVVLHVPSDGATAGHVMNGIFVQIA
jgi:hypothetical protein